MTQSAEFAAVESLLEERNALRQWLSRLAETGQAVPESVRQRVRGDYQARLDGVDARLRKHADAIASRLADDRAEHDDLMARSRVVRESLAEVELRHAVGEFDAERFEGERERFVAELQGFESSTTDAAERIARLEDVLAVISAEPDDAVPAASHREADSGIADTTAHRAAGSGISIDTSIDTPAASHREADSEISGTTTDREADSEITTSADDTALDTVEIGDLGATEPESPAMDDLLSIFDAEPAAPRFEAPEDPAPPVKLAGQGPLSFTPSGHEPPPVRPVSPPPIGMPPVDQTPRFVRPAEGRGSELVEAPGHDARHHHHRSHHHQDQRQVTVIPDPEPVLPVAPENATEPAARTLRCAECGAMNRPLEWYCEKCGAELSGM